MEGGLLVKVGKVKMNMHCRSAKRHPPSGAKDCPYCRVCAHGRTEHQHCDECNKDESWRHKPITDAELEAVLAWLSTCNPGYLVRWSKKKRDFKSGVPLVPLAVAKLRALVRAEKRRR